MSKQSTSVGRFVYGLDLGKRYSRVVGLAPDGEIIAEDRVESTAERFREYFGRLAPCRVVIEAGPISLWVNTLLKELGHEVLVANPRKVALIYGNNKKTDRVDAENLARLGRVDPKLLAPIKLRGLATQEDLALIRSRDLLVRQRTKMINHIRSCCSGFGTPLPKWDAHYFHRKVRDKIPENLKSTLDPLVDVIARFTEQIKDFDKQIEKLCDTKYPETKNLRQVAGVGALTALTFILTLHDPHRFAKSRRVGAFLGLVPRLDNSSNHNPQLRITKSGDSYLRRLLVTAAHYILGPHGTDCDLRRHGLKICPDGRNKSAKKRAVIAVARKLSVLLHRLWVTGETYDPHYQNRSLVQTVR